MKQQEDLKINSRGGMFTVISWSRSLQFARVGLGNSKTFAGNYYLIFWEQFPPVSQSNVIMITIDRHRVACIAYFATCN